METGASHFSAGQKIPEAQPPIKLERFLASHGNVLRSGQVWVCVFLVPEQACYHAALLPGVLASCLLVLVPLRCGLQDYAWLPSTERLVPVVKNLCGV